MPSKILWVVPVRQKLPALYSVAATKWEGRKVPTKSLFEQEAPKIGTQKCSTKRGVREPVHVELALNNRALVKAEVFEKRVFEQTTPFKSRNEGGIFLEQPFGRYCAASWLKFTRGFLGRVRIHIRMRNRTLSFFSWSFRMYKGKPWKHQGSFSPTCQIFSQCTLKDKTLDFREQIHTGPSCTRNTKESDSLLGRCERVLRFMGREVQGR